jgi:hypothetical protein
MRIRDSQMKAFQTEAERNFIERVIQFLREKHPGTIEGLAEDVIRRRVAGAVSKAKGYGFTWESALVGFVAILFAVGPNFDQHPAFQPALAKSGNTDENERIRGIYRSVTNQDWEEAREFSDDSAWTAIEEQGAP